MRSPTVCVCVGEMHIFSHSSPAALPQLHLNLWPVRSGPQLSTLSAATTTAILAKLFDLHVLKR